MKTIILAILVLSLCAGIPAHCTVYYNDGGVHNLDYFINDDVMVDYQSPGIGTTLNLQFGTLLGGHRLYGYCDSQIEIDGGETSYVYGYGNSHIVASYSMIDHLLASDNSYVEVQGWLGFGFPGQLNAQGNSHVTVSGARFDQISTQDDARLTLSGLSEISDLYLHGTSQVAITGGFIGKVTVADNSHVFITGGTITSILKLGNGQVTFGPVPEPSSLLALCGGLASLVGTRRRKS